MEPDLNEVLRALRTTFPSAEAMVVPPPRPVRVSELPLPIAELDCLEVDVSGEEISHGVDEAADLVAELVSSCSDWMVVGAETCETRGGKAVLECVYFVRARDGRDLQAAFAEWYGSDDEVYDDEEVEAELEDEDDDEGGDPWSSDAEAWKR
jgi:hypothetical protein